MSVEKAIKAYKEERLNCAQSLMKGFQDSHSVPDERIEEFRVYGGGRAEGGKCGALFGALSLSEDESERAALEESFRVHAGSLECREIRKLGKLSCAGCVELAARKLCGQ